MRIDFKSISKTFVMDFRDNGFPIDGKSILIDGNPWELNPGTLDDPKFLPYKILLDYLARECILRARSCKIYIFYVSLLQDIPTH